MKYFLTLTCINKQPLEKTEVIFKIKQNMLQYSD